MLVSATAITATASVRFTTKYLREGDNATTMKLVPHSGHLGSGTPDSP